MADFDSKYTGEQVESLLDQVASGNAGGGGGGGITVETDPIFSNSPAATITEEKKAEWDGKQEAIADLDTIRSGAAKGATALQEETYKGTVTGVKVNGETKSPSDGVVDLGSVGTYSKPSTGIPNSDLSEELREKLETAHRNAMAYQGTVTNIKINGVTKSANNGVVDLGNLGTYSKPSTGIPKSDLNPSIQTSLGKADTAVQPEDIKDEVYITDFDALSLDLLAGNHISSLEFNKQGLMDALAEHKVILVPYEISDNVTFKGYCTLVGFYEDLLYIKVITEYSEFIVETALDTQYILNQEITKRNWYDKQDALVSGENIKTINGESILGSGNITINGGGSSGGGKEPILSSSLYFNDASPVQPNKIYISNEAQTAMYIGAFQEASNYDEYCLIFKYPEEGVTLPESVKFANGEIPTIEYNTECELSVVGIGSGANRTYHVVLTPFKPV